MSILYLLISLILIFLNLCRTSSNQMTLHPRLKSPGIWVIAVKVMLHGMPATFHRSHPRREATKGAVEAARRFFFLCCAVKLVALGVRCKAQSKVQKGKLLMLAFVGKVYRLRIVAESQGNHNFSTLEIRRRGTSFQSLWREYQWVTLRSKNLRFSNWGVSKHAGVGYD